MPNRRELIVSVAVGTSAVVAGCSDADLEDITDGDQPENTGGDDDEGETDDGEQETDEDEQDSEQHEQQPVDITAAYVEAVAAGDAEAQEALTYEGSAVGVETETETEVTILANEEIGIEKVARDAPYDETEIESAVETTVAETSGDGHAIVRSHVESPEEGEQETDWLLVETDSGWRIFAPVPVVVVGGGDAPQEDDEDEDDHGFDQEPEAVVTDFYARVNAGQADAANELIHPESDAEEIPQEFADEFTADDVEIAVAEIHSVDVEEDEAVVEATVRLSTGPYAHDTERQASRYYLRAHEESWLLYESEEIQP